MTTTKQRDFFADAETPNRFFLPDKVSFIEHVRLDEGTFQKYQNLTSQVKLGRDGETTEIDMRLGAQRQFLFEKLVTGWNLVRIDKEGGKDVEKPIPFTHKKLFELPPHLLTGLIEDIYKKNEILGGLSDDDSSEESEEGKEEEKKN